MYDYLIVGAGLFGSVFAYEAALRGKRCLVLDKRANIGGNIYTEKRDNINVHVYGAHIFHTSKKEIWTYINQFAEFNNYINSPVANYKGKLYNLPFNMNTFYEIWGQEALTPEMVKAKIDSQRVNIKEPKNLEEQALSLIGRDVFEILIKGYTEKQWGRDCTELPPSILKRVPVRYRFDNNYFNDRYQGIPIGGYTQIIEKLLAKADVELNVDFNKHREEYEKKAKKVLYTGTLDSLFDFSLGYLGYRSEKFDTVRLEEENHQGVAVMNYTERQVPYTRVIEHKHFENAQSPVTWISYEYPVDYKETGEPYYPINDAVNNDLFNQYNKLAHAKENYIFGGRLAEYKYYDMDKTIESCLELVKGELI